MRPCGMLASAQAPRALVRLQESKTYLYTKQAARHGTSKRRSNWRVVSPPIGRRQPTASVAARPASELELAISRAGPNKGGAGVGKRSRHPAGTDSAQRDIGTYGCTVPFISLDCRLVAVGCPRCRAALWSLSCVVWTSEISDLRLTKVVIRTGRVVSRGHPFRFCAQ